MNTEIEKIPQPVARPAVRKIEKYNSWARIRFVTTIVVLILIILSAMLDINLGTFSSFSLGPITVACPLGVAQIMAASQTFLPGLALAGLLGFLLTVFFGRAFCGWLCPGRWIFNHGPRTAKTPWKYRGWVQGGIVASVIGAAMFAHNPLFCIICPVGAICRGAIAAGTGGSVLPSVGWLGALLSVEWLSGRSWCRDLCPVGATLSRISALNPFIKPKANEEKCRPCLACMKKCPENMNLSQTPSLASCTKCFACQGACPRDAVEINLIKLN